MTARTTAPVDPLGPEITALRRRQAELMAAVGTGESSAGWAKAQGAFDRLVAGLAVNPPTAASATAVNQSLASLRALLREGTAAASLWKDIRTNAETLRRLVDSTRRRGSAQDRVADREADRQARLEQAIQESGARRAPPPPPPRRPAQSRNAAPEAVRRLRGQDATG